MDKTNFAKSRLQRFEDIKAFLKQNKIFDLVELAKYLKRGILTTRHDLDFVCCREGFKLRSLGRRKDKDINTFEVIE